MCKDAITDETKRILSTDNRYTEVIAETGFARALMSEFGEVVFAAASLSPLQDDDKRSFIGSILQPARIFAAANIFSCLKYTVKTHKAAGEVCFRALHSSVNTPLQGAMKLISHFLKPKLATLSHLCASSAEVAQKLRSCHVDGSAYLLKIDIKDFFMDGSHSQIMSACLAMIDPAWRPCCKPLVEYILNTQYVFSPCLPGKLYKVRRGAGMGLLCSGELVDSTFYKTVEESILPDLNKWGVIGYFRFRDDILVIAECSRETLIDFVMLLKTSSVVWKLKVESVSQFEVCFLDLRLFKGDRWHATRCLDIALFHKETAQKQVLATHSLHAPHTHLSWPRSLVHRIFTLCNSRKYQKEELDRLKRMLADRCGVDHVALVFDPPSRSAPSRSDRGSRNIASRLVIPYHREWEIGAIHSTLQKVLARYSSVLVSKLNTHVTVSVAHTLQRRHLDIQLWNLWVPQHGRRLGTEVD